MPVPMVSTAVCTWMPNYGSVLYYSVFTLYTGFRNQRPMGCMLRPVITTDSHSQGSPLELETAGDLQVKV